MSLSLTIAVLVLIAAWGAADVIRRGIRKRDELVLALQRELANATAERDSARTVRDHWRESSGNWRKEALAQLAVNQRLLEKLERRVLPDDEGGEASDPPSVNEADQYAAEEARTRTPVTVADRAMPPIPRAESVGDEDEDDVGERD